MNLNFNILSMDKIPIDYVALSTLPKIDEYFILQYDILSHIKSDAISYQELDNKIKALETLSNTYNCIMKYGLTDSIRASLEDFEQDDIDANEKGQNSVLGNISNGIKKIWNWIIQKLEALWDWIKNDSILARYLNKFEGYDYTIAELILSNEKYFYKADLDIFLAAEIKGFNFPMYAATMNAVKCLINTFINTIATTSDYATIDIKNTFQLAMLNLVGMDYNDDGELYRAKTYFFETKTLAELGWTPKYVHDMTQSLHFDIIKKHRSFDKLDKSIQRDIKNAIQECKTYLQSDNQDNEKIEAMKQRIKNIQDIKKILTSTIDVASILAYQWINMARKIVIAK